MQHILFEHISGYELFELRSFEGLSAESYTDYLALTQVVNHVSSLPFVDAGDVSSSIALQNDGVIPEPLRGFLELNKVSAVHADRSLKLPLKQMGIEHHSSPEIMRGIRTNIHKLIKTGLNKQMLLSVSHTLSRSAIRYDMEREDNIVIAVGYECDQLEEEIEALSLRMNAMLDWVLPQFRKLARNGDLNARLSEILEQKLHGGDEGTDMLSGPNDPLIASLCRDLLDGLSEADLESLKSLNQIIAQKKRLLADLTGYLEEKMRILAPNLRCILGDRLCFKLIHKAGGLMNLSLLPTSTLQLLGAEKSLFRSLKMRTNTPKYGLIYNLEYLKANRGRMCRFIANKCSLAARIDSFHSDRTDAFGKELRKLIDKKVASARSDLPVETTHDLLQRVQSRLSGVQSDSSVCVDKKVVTDNKKVVVDNKKVVTDNKKTSDDKKTPDDKKICDNNNIINNTKKSSGKKYYDLTESAKRKMKGADDPPKKAKK